MYVVRTVYVSCSKSFIFPSPDVVHRIGACPESAAVAVTIVVVVVDRKKKYAADRVTPAATATGARPRACSPRDPKTKI